MTLWPHETRVVPTFLQKEAHRKPDDVLWFRASAAAPCEVAEGLIDGSSEAELQVLVHSGSEDAVELEADLRIGEAGPPQGDESK